MTGGKNRAGALQTVNITWEWGTGYDLFASLYVLHQPEKFGLRASWAAGVRSRLSPAQRKTLDDAQEVFPVPIHWLESLPGSKDGQAVLHALQALPPGDRLPALADRDDTTPELKSLLANVAGRGGWDSADLEMLRQSFPHRLVHPKTKTLSTMLEIWASKDAFGQAYLEALQAYYEVFFFEEEKHIRLVLQAALEQAQKLAESLSVSDLLQHLSQGVVLPLRPGFSQLKLAPSYWLTPFIVYDWTAPDSLFVLFGARPPERSLVPGESVPNAMLQSLKALADPTRLRILHYLSKESLTPSQLARLLRLRPPTVIHHLNALRLAGLVQFVLEEGGERHYAIRREMVGQTFDALDRFLS